MISYLCVGSRLAFVGGRVTFDQSVTEDGNKHDKKEVSCVHEVKIDDWSVFLIKKENGNRIFF